MGVCANFMSELSCRLMPKVEPQDKTRYALGAAALLALALTMLAYLPAQTPTLELSSRYVPAGNVRPRAGRIFEFTPDDAGRYVIQPKVHGSTSTLNVESQLITEVTSAPIITVSEDTLDFGQVFVDYADSLNLVVANIGTDVLLIGSVVANPEQYGVTPSAASINPGADRIFMISLLATAVGNHPGNLTILSNDPSRDTLVVTLLGKSVMPPIIAVSPESLTADLLTGETTTRTISIDNIAGGRALEWEIQLENIGLGTVTFSKGNFADWTLRENQDRITDNVWITRASTRGIFNVATENSYSSNSPQGTEWAYGLTDSLMPGDYQPWRAAVASNPPAMVGRAISLHLITDNIYFDVVFGTWTIGTNGGGFSYTRTDLAPRWLSVSQEAGVIPVDSAQIVEVIFDATGLFGGDYTATINISSNDPAKSLVVVPVALTTTPLAVESRLGLPQSFPLHQNYPNPFNLTTTLRFDLPAATQVRIMVFDLLGREVTRLVDRHLEAGYQRVVWGGRDFHGREVPTGMYIARFVTPEYTKSIKMVLLK